MIQNIFETLTTEEYGAALRHPDVQAYDSLRDAWRRAIKLPVSAESNALIAQINEKALRLQNLTHVAEVLKDRNRHATACNRRLI